MTSHDRLGRKYVVKVLMCSKKRVSFCGLIISSEMSSLIFLFTTTSQHLAEQNETNIKGAKCDDALWSHCRDVVTFGQLHNDSEMEQHLTDLWRLHTSDPVYQISALLSHRGASLSGTWSYGFTVLCQIDSTGAPSLPTDTCSLKMILSPAASITACSGGALESIIKLEKTERKG